MTVFYYKVCFTKICCPKYSLEHQMWINPLRKIVPNKCKLGRSDVEVLLLKCKNVYFKEVLHLMFRSDKVSKLTGGLHEGFIS